jgi:uncharacterized FlaG/YvyC family protein
MSYMLDLGLSDSFLDYYDAMVAVTKEVSNVENQIHYGIRSVFRRTFYNEDEGHAKKFCTVPEATAQDKQRFEERVSKLTLKLKQARELLNKRDLD